MSEYLPGYVWDARAQRYRNASTGRFVSRRSIVDQLEREVEKNRQDVVRKTQSYYDGSLSPGVWQEQVRQTLKRMNSQYAALAIGGWDSMTPRDWGRIGAALREDYQRVERLAYAVQNNEISVAQAIQRVSGYIGHARAQYYKAEASRKEPSSSDYAVISRRTLGVAEHCPDCLNYESMGWQRFGRLPVPTEGSQCGTYCQCDLVYREVLISEVEEWVGTKRRS